MLKGKKEQLQLREDQLLRQPSKLKALAQFLLQVARQLTFYVLAVTGHWLARFPFTDIITSIAAPHACTCTKRSLRTDKGNFYVGLHHLSSICPLHFAFYPYYRVQGLGMRGWSSIMILQKKHTAITSEITTATSPFLLLLFFSGKVGIPDRDGK